MLFLLQCKYVARSGEAQFHLDCRDLELGNTELAQISFPTMAMFRLTVSVGKNTPFFQHQWRDFATPTHFHLTLPHISAYQNLSNPVQGDSHY